VVGSSCEMSGCNVSGALGRQARTGEVRELQVGFEFRRPQASRDRNRRLRWSWGWSWSWSWSLS
jgi:hypothetical protein